MPALYQIFSSDSKTFQATMRLFKNLIYKSRMRIKRFSNFNLLLKAVKSFIQNPMLSDWGLNNFLALKQVSKILISSIFINKKD